MTAQFERPRQRHSAPIGADNPTPARPSVRLSRRAVMAGSAMVAAALAAGCSSRASAPPVSNASTNPGRLRFANWPGVIDAGSLPLFEKASGIDVTYSESINDMQSFAATLAPPLRAGIDPGFDLVLLDSPQATLFHSRGWLAEIPVDRTATAHKNVLPRFRSSWDPGFNFHFPYFSGAFSLGFNTRNVKRPLTSYSELLDPDLKGHVGLYSGALETYCLFALLLRSRNELSHTPPDLTVHDVHKVHEFLMPYARAGQFRFSGMDYLQGYSSGDLHAGFIGSADTFLIGNPDVRFTYAREGGLVFADSMVVPKGSQNIVGAAELIDFLYTPTNAVRLTEEIKYQTAVDGVQQLLSATDPKLAEDPLVFPPPDVEHDLFAYPQWTEDETKQVATMFEELTGR